MKKQSKGITLIALVITIIVLLILAGVSIATLAGDNGVLTKATDAKIVNELGAAKDEINLKVAEAMSDYYESIYLNNATSSPYSNANLVKTIMEKLQSEFGGKTYKDYTIAISGTTAGSTITVQSKAVPSLKTGGTIQSDGAINWGDTFKRTSSGGGAGGGSAAEILKEILNDEDMYSEAEDEGIIEWIKTKGEYEYYKYEGNYYKARWSDDEGRYTEVLELTETEVSDFTANTKLVLPDGTEKSLEKYEGKNWYQFASSIENEEDYPVEIWQATTRDFKEILIQLYEEEGENAYIDWVAVERTTSSTLGGLNDHGQEGSNQQLSSTITKGKTYYVVSWV